MTPAASSAINAVASIIAELGIQCSVGDNYLAVRRDSMCAKFPPRDHSVNSIPEEWAYPQALAAIRAKAPAELLMLWGGKTDDDLYLDIYVR